jgi:hypothetical protein
MEKGKFYGKAINKRRIFRLKKSKAGDDLGDGTWLSYSGND